jgi:hypothetical protein
MCWKCGKLLSVSKPVSRAATCPICGTDVRVCKNCTFHSPGAHYDCRETVEEQITDKERANFCEHFTLKTTGGAATGTPTEYDKAQQAKAALAKLFPV